MAVETGCQPGGVAYLYQGPGAFLARALLHNRQEDLQIGDNTQAFADRGAGDADDVARSNLDQQEAADLALVTHQPTYVGTQTEGKGGWPKPDVTARGAPNHLEHGVAVVGPDWSDCVG